MVQTLCKMMQLNGSILNQFATKGVQKKFNEAVLKFDMPSGTENKSHWGQLGCKCAGLTLQ
jgi:hypothetical protein